jgi:hypothetical protein
MNIFYDVIAPEIHTPRDLVRLMNALAVTWLAVGAGSYTIPGTGAGSGGRVPAHDIGRSDPPIIAIQLLCPRVPRRRGAFQSLTAGIRWPVRDIDCC